MLCAQVNKLPAREVLDCCVQNSIQLVEAKSVGNFDPLVLYAVVSMRNDEMAGSCELCATHCTVTATLAHSGLWKRIQVGVFDTQQCTYLDPIFGVRYPNGTPNQNLGVQGRTPRIHSPMWFARYQRQFSEQIHHIFSMRFKNSALARQNLTKSLPIAFNIECYFGDI